MQERPLKPEKTGQILTFRTKNPENEIPETDILDSYWDRLFIDQLQIGFPLIGSAAMCLQQWSGRHGQKAESNRSFGPFGAILSGLVSNLSSKPEKKNDIMTMDKNQPDIDAPYLTACVQMRHVYTYIWNN